MELLAKKNVLIVGATGGIGAEATKLIRNNQANVFITGRNQSKLNDLAKAHDIPAEQVYVLDITDAKAVKKVAESIHEQVDKIDVLVNAAGIGIIKPIESLTEEDFDQSIDINLKGTFYL